MTGSESPENETDRQCKHCGLWFSRRGVLTHERNCDLQEYDKTLIPLQEENDADQDDVEEDVDESDQDNGDVEEILDTVEGAEYQTVDEPDQEAATDGGPQELPEPEQDPDPDPKTEATLGIVTQSDDLPDHLITVDDYLDQCRQRGVSERYVLELADELEPFDVVDVEATTADTIEAYPWEEL